MNTRTVSVRWITVEICDVVHIGHNQLPKKNFYGECFILLEKFY